MLLCQQNVSGRLTPADPNAQPRLIGFPALSFSGSFSSPFACLNLSSSPLLLGSQWGSCHRAIEAERGGSIYCFSGEDLIGSFPLLAFLKADFLPTYRRSNRDSMENIQEVPFPRFLSPYLNPLGCPFLAEDPGYSGLPCQVSRISFPPPSFVPGAPEAQVMG